MRRGLLAIALGIAFLILATWLGTIVTNNVSHSPTAPVQVKQAGPYSVTLQVTPNPPPITQPATLSLRVLLSNSQQPTTNVLITLQSNMEAMDMGINQVEARPQGNGLYLANVQFPMSGLWQVQVIITSLESSPRRTPPASIIFEVTAQ